MRALFKICFPHKSATEYLFFKFYFSSVIVFTIFNCEPHFKEKFLRESGFPIFGRKFYVARWKLVFWPPFCTCISDFRFFFFFFFFFLLYFCSFGLLYQWPAFHRQIHSGKYFSELGSIGTPPWPLTGVHYLDHLSVKRAMQLLLNRPSRPYCANQR